MSDTPGLIRQIANALFGVASSLADQSRQRRKAFDIPAQNIKRASALNHLRSGADNSGGSAQKPVMLTNIGPSVETGTGIGRE